MFYSCLRPPTVQKMDSHKPIMTRNDDVSCPECRRINKQTNRSCDVKLSKRGRGGNGGTNLGRNFLFLSQPGSSLELVVAAGDARRRHGRLRGGVRVLPGHLGPMGREALLEGRDALGRLIVQRLGARHGGAVGLHRDQVRHLEGEREVNTCLYETE